MPIYEYHCQTCDKNFEYLVLGKDEPVCPTCNGKNIGRIMSVCGFLSKGSGGETVKSSSSSCSGCSATSCSTCH